jgi:hypothetical protein
MKNTKLESFLRISMFLFVSYLLILFAIVCFF